MALDGKKLRNIRLANGFSQEKLAAMCNVDKRTIQRAESGVPIALETAAFIAEAVSVSASTLWAVTLEQPEVAKKSWNDVILVPVNSGRRIVEILRSSFEAKITFDVEPSRENIGPLAQIAGLIELDDSGVVDGSMKARGIARQNAAGCRRARG